MSSEIHPLLHARAMTTGRDRQQPLDRGPRGARCNGWV